MAETVKDGFYDVDIISEFKKYWEAMDQINLAEMMPFEEIDISDALNIKSDLEQKYPQFIGKWNTSGNFSGICAFACLLNMPV